MISIRFWNITVNARCIVRRTLIRVSCIILRIDSRNIAGFSVIRNRKTHWISDFWNVATAAACVWHVLVYRFETKKKDSETTKRKKKIGTRDEVAAAGRSTRIRRNLSVRAQGVEYLLDYRDDFYFCSIPYKRRWRRGVYWFYRSAQLFFLYFFPYAGMKKVHNVSRFIAL